MLSFRLFRAGLFALTAAAGLATAVQAQPMSGDVVDGRSYARDVCADCHVVEDSQPRVYAHQARPFERIAKDPKTTELSLRVFLQTPHLSMPDFILTERQTDDVIAYILSLKERMVE